MTCLYCGAIKLNPCKLDCFNTGRRSWLADQLRNASEAPNEENFQVEVHTLDKNKENWVKGNSEEEG